MPKPRYTFKVSHTSADGKVEWEVSTITTEEAFGHFVSSLRTASNSSNWVEMRITQFTLAMMEGRTEYTALDRDLQGFTSFTRTATN